jgi:hypothetical protein
MYLYGRFNAITVMLCHWHTGWSRCGELVKFVLWVMHTNDQMSAARTYLFMVQVLTECYHSCCLFKRLQVWIMACVLLLLIGAPWFVSVSWYRCCSITIKYITGPCFTLFPSHCISAMEKTFFKKAREKQPVLKIVLFQRDTFNNWMGGLIVHIAWKCF